MPLYLFHGEDSYSSHQKALHWQREFDKKYGDLNRQNIRGENFSAKSFIEAVETVPFLSEKRLVIISDFLAENSNEEIKKVAALLDRIPEYSIVVFVEREKTDSRTIFFKTINKIGQVTIFDLLEMPQLVDWIKQQASRLKFQLQAHQLRFLAENVGPNLWQLSHELEKLSTYSGNNAVSNETLEKMISPSVHTSIFKLTDAIGLQNIQQALTILHQLLQRGENLMQVIAMITRHFRILIQTEEGLRKKMSPDLIAKSIKQHPFVVQNSTRQVKNFTIHTLKEVYRKLLDIDIGIKTGRIRITTEDTNELLLAVEQLIIVQIKK